MLLPQHLDHLRASGLRDETIVAAGAYSVDDPAEAGTLLNRDGDGPAPAIAFPIFDRTGAVVATWLRPDVLRTSEYECARGEEPKLYFSPAAPVPPEGLDSPMMPLVITIGVADALAAAQAGFCAVGVPSATSLHDAKHLLSCGEWRPLPDLAALPLEGRIVALALATGAMVADPAAIDAEAHAARMLLDAGSRVRLLRVPFPDGPALGLGAYLAGQPDPQAALKALLEEALDGDALVRARAALRSGDPAVAVLALAQDLSFAAALRVGGQALRDIVARELRSRLTKRAVDESITAFTHKLDVAEAAAAELRAQPSDPAEDPAIRAAAAELLCDPQLVQRFLCDVAADGLVGEQDAALTLLLVAVTRRTRRPVHAGIKAASAAGKNSLVRRVLAHVPAGDVVEVSDITPNALQHLGSMRGKIIVIVEAEGARRCEYTLRVAMSEGRLSLLTTGWVKDEQGSRLETRQHTIEGPATFITTTTRALLHDENETRLLEITLDESEEQTRRVVARQAQDAAQPPTEVGRQARERLRLVWRAALASLNLCDCVVPGAEALARQFPCRQVRARRDFQRVLDLAGAHALLHQRQRQVIDGRVQATDADVAAARTLCASLWRTGAPRLTAVAERLRGAFGIEAFSAKQAATALGYSTDATRRLLHALEEQDLAEPVGEHKGNRAGRWRLVGERPRHPEEAESQPDTPEGQAGPGDQA